jgi:DNA-binding NarL/FixJ family response regulator
MTEKLTLLEFDASTGIEVIRELTKQEADELKEIHAQFLQRAQEAAAKQQARESALAKLAALGLTEDEIAAL